MKIRELTALIEKAIAKHNIDQVAADDYAEYSYYGLRFENKVREVGETCGNSRHNAGREDNRDFPEYGTEDYENMIELNGASAWYIDGNGVNVPVDAYKDRWQSDDDDLLVVAEHCYIIGGDVDGGHDDPDENEIVIQDAVVVEVLF